MDRIIASSTREQSLLSTHKVLRNTYFLLSLTLGFSAVTATLSTVLNLPSPGLILTLVGFYGLMFLTYRLADRPAGILAAFALTGFYGVYPRPAAEFVDRRRRQRHYHAGVGRHGAGVLLLFRLRVDYP